MHRISPIGIQLICEFEGFSATAYRDVVGVWTIGYGTTRVNNTPVVRGMKCTLEQAKEWMRTDMRQFESAVNAVDPSQKLTQWQFDACVALAYNIGGSAFTTSTVGRKIRANAVATVAENNFVAWNKVRESGVLVESRGLTRRRRAEYHLFSTGELKTTF